MTIKALSECEISTDNKLSLDGGMEASSALVYGCVRLIKDAQNYHDYQVEDGTGSVFIRQWINEKTANLQQEPI